MERKRYQFCLNTLHYCFLCSENIFSKSANSSVTHQIKKFSLKTIFQYLKINLTQIQSLCKKPLSILNKTEVRVSLCSDCEIILDRFTKQYRELEICKMKVKSSLKDIFAKLKSEESLENNYEDEQALKHLKIVKELRQMFVTKSQQKIQNSLPRVVISKRCEVPEQNLINNYGKITSVFSLKSSELSSTPSIKCFVEPVKEETPDEGDDAWQPETEEHLPPTDSKPEVDLLKTSSSEFPFKKHVQLYKSKKYKCDICGKAFKLKYLLTRHQLTHDCSKLRYKCPHCSTGFFRKCVLIKHVAQIHKKKISHSEITKLKFKCPHSLKPFCSNDELVHPLETHKNSFKCPKCPSRFSYKTCFMKHLKNHGKVTQRKSLLCEDPDCDEIFPSETELKLHEKSHLQSRKLLLERFISALPEGHGLERELANFFQCPYCPSTFTTLLDFQAHLKSAHELRPASSTHIECNICSKKFKCQNSLARHFRHHPRIAEAETDFQCKICKRQLQSLRRLRTHLKNHEANPDWDGNQPSEKYSTCPVCKQKLTTRALEDHMRTHTGEWLTCKLCPKKLKSRISLRRHIKNHSSLQNKFFCKDCNTFFKTEEILEKHRKVKHPDPNLIPTCVRCGKVFVSEKNLLIHKREFHSGEKTLTSASRPLAELIVTFNREFSYYKNIKDFSTISN